MFSGLKVLILVGPPGSGKGTQAKNFSQKNSGWVHVSTGDLFRKEISSGSELGNQVKGTIDSGKLVSDETTNLVFESQVRKILEGDGGPPPGLLLDGYPRNGSQAERFLKFSKTLGISKIKVVEFEVPEEKIVERISNRLTNPRTGKVYHRIYSPPRQEGKCDLDGGPLVQRADDAPEVVRKRFRVYAEQRDLIIETLAKGGIKSSKIDGIGKPEEVFSRLDLASQI